MVHAFDVPLHMCEGSCEAINKEVYNSKDESQGAMFQGLIKRAISTMDLKEAAVNCWYDSTSL